MYLKWSLKAHYIRIIIWKINSKVTKGVPSRLSPQEQWKVVCYLSSWDCTVSHALQFTLPQIWKLTVLHHKKVMLLFKWMVRFKETWIYYKTSCHVIWGGGLFPFTLTSSSFFLCKRATGNFWKRQLWYEWPKYSDKKFQTLHIVVLLHVKE